MYLKSIQLENFRKFRDKDNKIEFINAEDYKKDLTVNIAPKTTLIIGKNNCGKTTVIDALNKLINGSTFRATDFNFNYLKELLELYTSEYLDTENIKLPELKFIITVGIDNNEEDLLTNIIPFMSLEDTERAEIKILITWSVKDSELLIKNLKKFIEKDFKNQKFDRFLEMIEDTDYEISYFNLNHEKRKGFALKNLIELTSIKANNINNNYCLSEAFRKIVEYRYKNIIDPSIADDLDTQIISINENLTNDITKQHTDNINSSLSKIILGEKCQVLLKSDLNFKNLIKNILKYEYIEGNNNIPEEQFGLGYTNLMMIIAEIITYMEKYPETSFNSQINLISIEEPETFMHPQMQEQFIKNINEMIASLLENNDKRVNSQIIITTHSSHIVNSKIHEGNTLNNINYITVANNYSKSVCLNDEVVLNSIKGSKKQWKKIQNLRFLKKHIKYKVSELFFADAAIFVEGITEYTLLQHYLNINPNLNKYYISIFLADGAHAKVYEKLISALSIPTLIITDMDVKRERFEKGEKGEKVKEGSENKSVYLQMCNVKLKGRETTNSTLSHFYRSKYIEEIIGGGYKQFNNLMVLCQKDPIENYYASSFEEAFILTNSKNSIVNNTIKKIKPNIYQNTVKSGGLIENSFKLQKKLSDSKSDFANTLLYEILVSNDETSIPELPKYIKDGLSFLEEKLGGN